MESKEQSKEQKTDAKWLMPQVTVVICHGGECPDGFLSRVLIQRLYPKITRYHMVHHGASLPPLLKTDVVLMCDYVYPAELQNQLRKSVEFVFVIDHHKTAQKTLADWPNANKLFDMKRSAAGLVWRFLHPDVAPPRFVDLIEDRDIWSGRFADTEFLAAFLQSAEQNVELYEQLLTDSQMLDYAIKQGMPLVKARDKQVDQVVRHASFRILNGQLYGIVNSSILASDIGNRMMQTYNIDFAAVFSIDSRTNQSWYSLRSANGKTDVEEVAKKFGGGGLRNAAGMTLDGLVGQLPGSSDGALIHQLVEMAVVRGSTAYISCKSLGKFKEEVVAEYIKRLRGVRTVVIQHA